MKVRNIMRMSICGTALGVALALSTPTFVNAQGAPVAASTNVQVPVQRILLAMGKSAIVDLPTDARDVVVADPTVADAVMRTARRGFLLGQKNGETNVYFLDAAGRQILTLEVSSFDPLLTFSC